MKKKDPTSHRIIEKRRRDRMNNCLADLSKLIPAHYLKKGRGRVEKTEIIEMAIKHLKDLIEISNAQDKQAAANAGQVYAAEDGASSAAGRDVAASTTATLVYQLQPQAQPILLANGLASLDQRAALPMVEVESAAQMSSQQHLLDLRHSQAAPNAALVAALYSSVPGESPTMTVKCETDSPPPPNTRTPIAGHKQRGEGGGRPAKAGSADKLYLQHQNQLQPHRFPGCRQRHTCDYLNRHNLRPDGNTIGHVRHKPASTYHRTPKLRRPSPTSSSTNSDSGSCSSGGGGSRSSSDMSSAGYNSGANGSGSGDNGSEGSAENNSSNNSSSGGGQSGLVNLINGGGAASSAANAANKCGTCHKRIQPAPGHYQSNRNLREHGDKSGQLQLIEQMKSNSITNGVDFSQSASGGGHHNHLSGAAAASARAEDAAGCQSAASTCAWYKKTWLLRLQSRS